MKPFFPYFGSKLSLARYYGYPKYRPVIEPFAGSACYAVYWGVRDAILIDKNEIICAVWKFLIDCSDSDIKSIPTVFDTVDELSVIQEVKWLIGFWINRGSEKPRLSRSTWAKSEISIGNCMDWGEEAKSRIISQKDRIKNWKIIQADY